jgi:hypothetical protein
MAPILGLLWATFGRLPAGRSRQLPLPSNFLQDGLSGSVDLRNPRNNYEYFSSGNGVWLLLPRPGAGAPSGP